LRETSAVRKIIDASRLQSEELRSYLSRSRKHFAVLTDHAGTEIYKNDPTRVYRSMAVLSDFPDQVVVLKRTSDIVQLSGQSKGLQRRLIDHPQTATFPVFCRNLRIAQSGKARIDPDDLASRGRAADYFMTVMDGIASRSPQTVDALARAFTAAELAAVRSGAPLSQAVNDKLSRGAAELALYLFRDVVGRLPPHRSDAPNTFLFRLAVCHSIWSLGWISVGGAHMVKPDRLRNDLIDQYYATYATFFDGLITGDKGMAGLYEALTTAMRDVQRIWA